MKSVLITGAYSPLGHAIAEKFFKENYLVYGTSTREREDGCFKTICVDIRDEKDDIRIREYLSEKILIAFFSYMKKTLIVWAQSDLNTKIII